MGLSGLVFGGPFAYFIRYVPDVKLLLFAIAVL